MASPSIRHSFYSTGTIAIQRRKMSAYPGKGKNNSHELKDDCTKV
jgi:hypothetical protein